MSDIIEDESGTLCACSRCGYLIPPHRDVRCPECGFQYGVQDLEILSIRVRVLEDWQTRGRLVLAAWGMVWVVYSLVGMFMLQQDSYGAGFFDGVVIPITLWAVISSSLGFGWLACRFSSEHQRRLLWISWLKVLPIVHLSWLSIAGFTIVGVVFAEVGRWIGGADSGGLALLLTVFIVISFGIWAIGSFVLVVIWSAEFRELLEAYLVVRCQPGVGMLYVLGIVLWIVNGVVGLMGGMLGVSIIMEISPY